MSAVDAKTQAAPEAKDSKSVPAATSASHGAPATGAAASPACARCPKIDLHTHILPENIPDFRKRFGYGDFIMLEPCKNEPNKVLLLERRVGVAGAECSVRLWFADDNDAGRRAVS